MNKIFKILLFISFSINAYSQTINNYNGNFELVHLNGKANYSYYTLNDNRIFHGLFNFTSNDNSFKVSGNYNHDLKNGKWQTNLNNYKHKGIFKNLLINAKINGEFNNGNKTGNWKIKKTKLITPTESGISKYNKNSINFFSYLFTGEHLKKAENITIVETSETNFKDNHFHGNYNVNINDKLMIKGQFNTSGQCDGIWIIDYLENNIQHITQVEFINGIVSIITDFNQSTGKKSEIYKCEVDLVTFFNNYNTVEQYSIVENKAYSIKPLYSSSYNRIDIIQEFLNNWNDNSYYINEVKEGINTNELIPINELFRDYDLDYELQKKKEKEIQEIKRKEYKERKIVLERKQELERKVNIFNNSNAGKIQNKIQNLFDNWLVKDEFENNDKYATRVNKTAKNEFKRIENEVIKKSKNLFLRDSYFVNLDKYNTDTQSFSLKNAVEVNDNSFLKNISIGIPANLAKQLKEKINTVNSTFNSHIYLIPIDAELHNNNWVVVKALVIFDFVTLQMKGNPKKYFTTDNKGNHIFKYKARKSRNKIYPVSKTGYVQEGKLTTIKLQEINNLNQLNKKDKFLHTIWELTDLKKDSKEFSYSILNGKSIINYK